MGPLPVSSIVLLPGSQRQGRLPLLAADSRLLFGLGELRDLRRWNEGIHEMVGCFIDLLAQEQKSFGGLLAGLIQVNTRQKAKRFRRSFRKEPTNDLALGVGHAKDKFRTSG